MATSSCESTDEVCRIPSPFIEDNIEDIHQASRIVYRMENAWNNLDNLFTGEEKEDLGIDCTMHSLRVSLNILKQRLIRGIFP